MQGRTRNNGGNLLIRLLRAEVIPVIHLGTQNGKIYPQNHLSTSSATRTANIWMAQQGVWSVIGDDRVNWKNPNQYTATLSLSLWKNYVPKKKVSFF